MIAALTGVFSALLALGLSDGTNCSHTSSDGKDRSEQGRTEVEGNGPSRPGGKLQGILIGESKILRFDLAITIDRLPFDQIWQEHLNRLYKYLDRDGSGGLTVTEVEGLPWQQILCNAFGAPVRQPEVHAQSELTKIARQEGIVSVGEFTRIVCSITAGNSPVHRLGPPPHDGIEELFDHMDANHDRQLNVQELEEAEGRLLRLDADSDGLVSLPELAAHRSIYAAQARFERNARADASSLLTFFTTSSESQRVARGVLDHWRIENRVAGAAGIPSEILIAGGDWPDKADKNRDEKLTLEELASFFTHASPAVVVRADLGGGGGKTAVVADPSAHKWPDVRMSECATGTECRIGDFIFEVRTIDTFVPLGQSLIDGFGKVDSDGSGALDANELRGARVYGHCMSLADRNRDSQLDRNEVAEYVTMVQGAIRSQIQIAVTDCGPELFRELDRDGSEQLTVRELRDGTRLLGVFDKDADGSISLAEIPRRYRIEVGRGFGRIQGHMFAAPSLRKRPMYTAQIDDLPVWFRFMDINQDGDVAPNEFHGPHSAFQAMDLDRDGLIQRSEGIAERKRRGSAATSTPNK